MMRGSPHRSSTARDERGAVMVLVAVTLPVLILFMAFGIEIGHWYDYSRNLQNRADAAALAAGDAYGGICFGSPTSAQTDAIGEVAQQYSGPPAGTPDANLPYTAAQMTAAGLTYQNQPNLTKGTPNNYHVLLNSPAYWNQGGSNWGMESAAEKTSDPAPPSSLAICSSTDEDGNTGPMVDVRVTQSNLALFFPFFGFTPTISAHARVGLQGVGAENNIIPLAVRDPAEERCVEANFFNGGTQIATVALKKIGIDPTTGDVQWDNSANPVSVPFVSGQNVYEQIVTGYCDQNPSTYDSGSGLLYINSYGAASPGSGQAPGLTTGGVTLTGPCPNTTDKLANQYFTDEPCSVGVTAHVAFAPDVPYTGPTGPSQVTATDRSGQGGGPLPLSKLSTQVNGTQNNIPANGLLTVNSTAGFAPSGSINDNGGSNGNGPVTTFDYSKIVSGTQFQLTKGGSFGNNDYITQTGDTTWTSSGGFTINPGTSAVPVGQHPISISATQKFGSEGGNSCNGGCTTNFNVQQQTFGVCDDGNPSLVCNNPSDDSGPIVLAQLRLASDPAGTWASDPAQTYGENAFAGGTAANPSTQQLVATVELAGLSNAKPSDAPTTLRFDENNTNNNGTDHATGLIDCGQGSGTSAAFASLVGGCPTVGTAGCSEPLACAPLAINERPVTDTTPCNPEGSDLSGTIVARPNTNTLTAAAVPVDCIGTVGGQKNPIVAGVACRIITDGCTKNGQPNGSVCSSDNWSPTEGAASIPAGDPRAITVVITAPSDLARNNSGQIIPIENFAVFYVTGWTGQGNGAKNPSCDSYAPAPLGVAGDAWNGNLCPGAPVTLDDGGKGKNGSCSANAAGGSIWGYWMKYTDVGAISSGQPCNPAAFGDCTPVLTR
jgi:hypothetical protein